MILKLQNLLAAKDVAALTKSLSKSLGKSGAGPILGDAASARAGAKLREDFKKNAEFASLAMAREMSDFSLCHLSEGMSHSLPFDNPVIDPMSARPVRADLWVTLFLSDPADYDGGELVINSSTATERVKLNAGDAVIYPATNFQTVSEVRRGTRLTADAAVQSFVRGEDQRKVLMEVHSVLNWMLSASAEHQNRLAPSIRSLRRARANLYRLWAEV